MVAEAFGGTNRVPRINPYLPARSEYVGDPGDPVNANDVGKALKVNGDTTDLCVSGNEIYGFLETLEVATHEGYHYGGVVCDVGHEALAWDEAGTLTVGALVVAGTLQNWGVAMAHGEPNVIAGTPATHRWQVLAKYTAGSNAGKVMLRKV